jgi:Ser/Thr protein kinase RdoA (MazF antagonist)
MDDVLLQTPALSLAEALQWARALYGIEGDGHLLPSERDQNCPVGPRGDRFVLKIANATDERSLLEAQTAALAHVARRTALCPRLVPGIDGAAIGEITSAAASGISSAADVGRRRAARLGAGPPGRPARGSSAAASPSSTPRWTGSITRDPPRLLLGPGGRSAARPRAGAARRGSRRCARWSRASRIDRARDAARFARLRRAAVHNDPNDYNVLVRASA